MYLFAISCDTRVRSLDADDIAGVRAAQLLVQPGAATVFLRSLLPSPLSPPRRPLPPTPTGVRIVR